jgi:hypothetical protein
MKLFLTTILISLYSIAFAQPASVYVGNVTNKIKIGPLEHSFKIWKYN